MCSVSGKDCNEFIVNGTSASNDGYPEVDVQYTMKICNYNDFNMTFAPDFPTGNDVYEPRSYLDFWYTIPVNEVRTKVLYKSTRKYTPNQTSVVWPLESVRGSGLRETRYFYCKALYAGDRERGTQGRLLLCVCFQSH